MNNVVLMGRLTRDPEVKVTTGENSMSVARFTLAVNRRFKNAEGKYDADFINCVAFGKTADFVTQYFHKGDMMAVTGEIRTGSYTNKEGVKVYTTDVNVNTVDFCGGKSDGTNPAPNTNADFVAVPDNVSDEGLPF